MSWLRWHMRVDDQDDGAVWMPDLKGPIGKQQGTANITAAVTSVVVTHGSSIEDILPLSSDIILTPTTTWGLTTKWWISAITATTFTINVDIAPGATLTFAWQINRDALTGWREIAGAGTVWGKTFNQPNLVAYNDTGVANRSWQMMLGAAQIDPEQGYGQGAWWEKPYIFRCASMPFRLNDPSTHTAFGGIQIGTPFIPSVAVNPPWQTNPQNAYCRLGRPLDLTTSNYYFECASGDGVTPKKRVEFSIQGDLLSGLHTSELLYDPVSRAIVCRVNNRIVYTETDLAYLPRFGAQASLYAAYGAGLYIETGSGADRVQGFWAFPQIMVPARTPAVLWY